MQAKLWDADTGAEEVILKLRKVGLPVGIPDAAC